VNADRCVNILRPFLAEVTEEEKLYCYFQQDSATAHTAHVSLEALSEVFVGRIISRGFSSPHSPDLTRCDFYLWGSLDDKVYKRNPHTLEKPRNTSAARLRRFPGKNSRELITAYSAGTWSAFVVEANIFSICHSPAEFFYTF
jgi:hypothetical protein